MTEKEFDAYLEERLQMIRNTLSQTLERGDRFVVVDATRDRLAWFNLGPEVDVRISKVWNGPLRPDTEKAL